MESQFTESAPKASEDGVSETSSGGFDSTDQIVDEKKWTESCPTFSFRLGQGDFAYLNGYYWKGEARPCDKGEGEEKEVEKVERDMEERPDEQLGESSKNKVRSEGYALVYMGMFG